MTEAEWLACADPRPMLRALRKNASERKLRLFAVGCCRRADDVLADERRMAAVAAAERFADGAADSATMAAELNALIERFGDNTIAPDQTVLQTDAPILSIVQDVVWAVQERAVSRRLPRLRPLRASLSKAVIRRACDAWRRQEAAAQAKLLRDAFGPRPACPCAVAALWLTSTVVDLAQAIYADRAFDRLPILADALEDAGCTNANILSHCRLPGEHARGCWVVDLVLSKE